MKYHDVQNLLPYRGEVFFYPAFFPEEKSKKYFVKLLDEVYWQQLPIKIFGKEIMQPRLTAWFGDPGKSYTYSGLTLQAQQWNPSLLKIKRKVEDLSKTTFNSALLNQYRDGNDSMGWHRDNEKELGKEPAIASVSFGASRTFQLRDYETKEKKSSVELIDGSLLLMSGESQRYWEHCVPKSKKVTEKRINITFRKIL